MRPIQLLILCVISCVALACGDDEAIDLTTTTTTNGDESPEGDAEVGDAEEVGEADADEGVDDTAGEGMGGDAGEEGDCSEYPLPFEEEDDRFLTQRENGGDPVVEGEGTNSLDGTEACPGTFDVTASVGGATAFYVYRPIDTSGLDDWPDAELPLAVFVKAVGSEVVDDDTHVYGHIFDELAASGFVVVAIEGNHTGAESRRNAVLCATEWAQTTYATRLNCDRVLIGHSQGAYVIHNMVPELTDGSPPIPFGPSARLRAIVEIAPTVTVEMETSVAVDPEDAVPTLVLHSPIDDNGPDGITQYDRMGLEDNVAGPLPIDGAPDKALIWAYRIDHYTWGGRASVLEDSELEEQVARAHAISSFYIPAFLRWQLYAEPESRAWFVAPTLYNLGVEAFPAEVQNSELWADIYADDTEDDYLVLDDRPVMFVGLTERNDVVSHRLQVDTMYREEQLICSGPGQPIEAPSAPLGEDVSILGNLDDELTCFSDSQSQSINAHETEALRAPWGSAEDGDGLRWELTLSGSQGLDLTGYDDLSFRAARRDDPFGDRVPFSARVTLETGMLDDDGENLVQVPLVYDRLVARDNSFGAEGIFMHTVRFPLGDFCASEQGFDISDVRAIEIVATEPGDDASFLHIDSLEFTRSEFGSVGSVCPAEFGVWACEATGTLVATETSCGDEPVSGVCDPGDVDTNPVGLPYVSAGGGFDGWLVDTPPGYVGDINDPTLGELERIATRCRAACEREYAFNPHVAANCDASGAFETPYLVEVSHTSARRTIADADVNGAGLYEAESLGCSLLDDCCLGFDEDVCPAAPWRVTTAESQLHRGEEYLLSMSGELKLYSVDDDIYEEAEAIGTIGYANCAWGNDTAPCPLYIGSAHAETIETLAIEVDCDGTPFPLAMELITIDLAQPALGINAEDSEEGGFPPGSLVLRTHAEAGLLEVDALEVNTAPVYAPASGGWAQVLANGGSKTKLQIDCGAEIKTFEAWFDLNADAAIEQPPLVEIDMPSTVSCNTPVTLDANVADPDGDDDTLRWEVDGVLLAPSMTTLQITQPHEIRAIVKDDRRATTTDVHSITCT